jgi:hypothetical protein
MTYLEFSITIVIALIFWAAIDFDSLLDLGYTLDAYITLAIGYLRILPSYLKMLIATRVMLYKMKREFKIYAKTNRKPN